MTEIEQLDQWKQILLDIIDMLQELNEGMEEIWKEKSRNIR